MEEKERYDRHSYYPQRYIDNETNKIINIKDTLNRQDKRIKELEKENQQLKEQLALKEELHIAYCSIENVKTKNGNLKEENQQLKQSQKQLAIEELEKLKEEMVLNGNDYCEIRQGTSPHNPTDYAWFNYVVFIKFINNQIKSLKGEE